MKNVFIVAAKRSPIGSFGGSLSSLSATDIAAQVVQQALAESQIPADLIDTAYIGNVVSANLGQAPARQVIKKAGLPNSITCTLINKVCASGMKAIALGAQSIQTDESKVVLAGGMENMSQIPFYLPNARYGYGYGDGKLLDGLSRDGLSDAYEQVAMGVYADKTAERYEISREEQDDFAIASYKRTAEAWQKGYFTAEIASVSIPQKRSDALVIAEDEEYKKVNFDKIPSLKPVFTPNGTVTAANASTINDGAIALFLADEETVKKHNLKPIARIVAFADAEQEPQWFTTTPVLATEKVLKRANLSLSDIDFFEVNEAFAAVPLAYMKKLGISHDKVNVWGGAVSIGHPLGVSGARIVGTLARILQHKQSKYGLAAICNGGGGASAMIIERV